MHAVATRAATAREGAIVGDEWADVQVLECAFCGVHAMHGDTAYEGGGCQKAKREV